MLNHLNMKKERWYDDCQVCNAMHKITSTLRNNATYIFVIEYMYWAQENICLHLGKCQALEYCVSYSRFVWPIFYDLSLVILLTFTHLSVDLDDVALLLAVCITERIVFARWRSIFFEKRAEGDTFIIRTSRFTCLFTDLLQSVREDFWGLWLRVSVTGRKWEKGQLHEKLYFCLVLLWKIFWWIIFCCKSQSFS